MRLPQSPDRPHTLSRGTARLPVVLAALAVFAVLAAACGSGDSTETEAPAPTATPTDDTAGDDDPSESGDDGTDGTTTDPTSQPTEAPTPTPADTTPPATPTPIATGPATVVVTVFTAGGFAPVDATLAAFPELVIMSDGVAYRPAPQIAVFPPPLVPAVERVTIGADGVAAVLDAITTSGLLGTEVDFGDPGVTDAPSTILTSFVAGEEQFSAYALGFEGGVLGEEANEARRTLAGLIEELNETLEGAPAEVGLPDRVSVLTFPGLGFQEDAQLRPWPIDALPTPVEGQSISCVTVEGDELATLIEAAADATTQTPWNIEGRPAAVVLRPVFANEAGC